MTIYNKTKQSISFGSGKYTLTLPASSTEGVRGEAVELAREPMKRVSLSMEWKRALALQEAGDIEIVE